MNIRFITNKSMKQFHENENIQKLVSICIENNHNTIFDDIILLISSKSKYDKFLFIIFFLKGGLKLYG